VDYHEHAVGAGADATAVAYVEIQLGDGVTLFGVGMHENIVTASLRAVISAVNRMMRRRETKVPHSEAARKKDQQFA
jgi:2-isopropylmalate synthase